MQKTKRSLFLCSSLLCIWKLLPCLCFIFFSTDCTDPISSIFHCRSCFLVLWSFSHWIIRTVWKEKSIKIIVLVIIIIKINDSITMHFIWAIANLTLPLMFNNVYTDISLQIVLLCYVGSQPLWVVFQEIKKPCKLNRYAPRAEKYRHPSFLTISLVNTPLIRTDTCLKLRISYLYTSPQQRCN